MLGLPFCYNLGAMDLNQRPSLNVTINLTAFRSILLGMLLVLVLTACDGRQTNLPPQATLPNETVVSRLESTPTPKATRSPSRYVTRTPTSGPPQPTATLVETLDVLPEELSGQKIAFWYPWQGQLGEVMQEMVDEYNRTNQWGVKVEVRAFDSFASLEQAFDTALATGDIPGLLVAYDDKGQHWDQGGQRLVDLQAYIDDPNWGWRVEEQADFYLNFWQQGTAYLADGHGQVTSRQLSVPLHRSEVVLFYNRSWAVELGFKDAPDTLDDLRSQVCNASQAMRENKGDVQAGGLMIASLPATSPGKELLLQPEQLLAWIGAYGGQVDLPEGKGYQFDTLETQRALEYLKDLQKDGCIYLSVNPVPADEFAARLGLVYVASTAELAPIKAAFAGANNQDEWMILPFPAADDVATVVAYGPSLLIPQTGKVQQLAAWTLLKWLVYPPNQARWVQAVGAYPTRYSTNDYLDSAITANPAWADGLQFLPIALAEPSLSSWSVVRWAMGDALAELFSSKFDVKQIPDLLESLELLVEEINTQVR